MTDDDRIARIKRRCETAERHTTHYEGCHVDHRNCETLWLLNYLAEARATITALTQEKEEMTFLMNHYLSEFKAADEQVSKLAAHVTALTADLQKYAQHLPTCAVRTFNRDHADGLVRCTCGFTDVAQSAPNSPEEQGARSLPLRADKEK